MPLPLNVYTPAGIAANAQAEYDLWAERMRAEQARQEAEYQAAVAQQQAAAEELARLQAQQAQQAQQEQAQQEQAQQEQAPQGRGAGFTDPRLIGSPTEKEQVQRGPLGRGPAAPEEPTVFDSYLATQQLHPQLRTRSAFNAAPRDVQEELVRAGWPAVVKEMGWTAAEAVRQRRAALKSLVTAPADPGALTLAGAADLALSFGAGVAGVVKSVAAAFGPDNAVASAAAQFERQFADSKSEGSKRQTAWLQSKIAAARAAGRTDQEIMAWLVDGLGASPGETFANLAGSVAAVLAAPVAVAAAPVAGAGAAAAAAAVGINAASGYGAVTRGAFEGARDHLLASGVAPAEATRQAELAAGDSSITALAMLNATVSGVGGRLGVEKAILPLIGRKSASVVGTKSAASAGLGEAATELPSGVAEALAGNLGAETAGSTAPLTQGLALAGVQSVVLGGAAGAAAHGGGALLQRIRARQSAQASSPAAPAAAVPATPAAAAMPAADVPAVPAADVPAVPAAAAMPAGWTPPVVGVSTPAPANAQASDPQFSGVDLLGGAYVTTIAPPKHINSTGELTALLQQTGQAAHVQPSALAAASSLIVKQGGATRGDVEAALGIALGQRTVSLGETDLAGDAAATIKDTTMTRGKLDKVIVDKLRAAPNGISAADLARELSTDPARTPFEVGMFKWLSDRMGADLVTLGPTRTANTYGTYKWFPGSEDSAVITLGVRKGTNTWVLMHEMVHAATVRMLHPSTQLDESQVAAKSAVDQLFTQYQGLQVSPMLGGVLSSVQEFVAEGLANPTVRGILKVTKLQDTTTMWDKFRNSLRGLVGLPTSVAPDNMLDALLDATDTLSPPRAAAARATLETGVAQPIVDNLTMVRGTVSDTVFVRASTDSGGTTRGSAVLDPDIGAYRAVWHNDDGTVVRGGPIPADVDKNGKVTQLVQQVALKNWFDDRDPNRQPVYTVDQRLAGQMLNVQQAINQLDALAPTSRKVFEGLQRAVRTIPMADRVFTQDMLLSVTRALAGLHQWAGSRYSPTDAVRDGAARYATEMADQMVTERGMTPDAARSAVDQVLAGVGTDAVIRRSAKATAERTMIGASGDKSLAQHKGDLMQVHKELRALGVPADTVNDYAYAVSAIQANAIRSQEYPTDTMGYPMSKDKAKFSFYTDSAGRIIPMGDAADPPPGAKLHEGVSAPFIFRTLFEQQYPSAAAKAKSLMDVVAAINLRVLDVQLASGAITQREFAALRQQQYYLPMQQPNDKLKSRGGAATGRRSRAVNPLAQLLAVSDMRVDHAAYAGTVRDVARALRVSPNPALAVIGAHTRKLKPAVAKDEETPPASVVEMVRLDWSGDNTVIFREGDDTFELTITDPALLRALKSPTANGVMDAAIGVARTITHFQAFTRTAANLSFLLAQIPIDLITSVLNAQGAWRSARDGGMVLTPAQAREMSAKLLPGMVANLGSSIGATYRPLNTRRSPIRRLYDSHGGGVHMDARIGFTSGVDMLGSSRPLTGTAAGMMRRGAATVEHLVQGMGHVWSDAIRFTGFKTYLEQMHGKPFRSEAELQRFIDANPNRLAEAITGSKNLLGNFERTGTTVLAKAVLPFFNAGMVGLTQVTPQVIASTHGRQALALMTGAVFFSAMAVMQSPDDEDTDGVSRFLSGQSAWKDLVIGGWKVPLNPEFRPVVAGAVLAAAAVTGAKLPKDDGFFVSRVLHSMLETLPVRVPDFDDASLMHAIGILGVPLMLSAGIDQFGKQVAKDGNSIDASAPEWTQVRNTDSDFAASTAESLTRLGLDIAPGTITTLTAQFTGAIGGMWSEMDKGTVDGRGALGAGLEWIGKRFVYDAEKESKFGTAERLRAAEQRLLGERDPDQMLANRDEIERQRRDITAIRTSSGLTVAQAVRQQAVARRAGDAEQYQALQEEIKDAMERQSAQRTTAIEMLKMRNGR